MDETVAESLLRTLVDAGVRRIYGIVGDSLNPLTDAIRRSGTVKWIHVRHEEAAAFAAGADAELTDQLAVCAGSCSGDGGLAMLMGELLTLGEHELPVKIVLFNNDTLGMVQLEMEVAGFPHGCHLKNPNFAAVAQAVGLDSVRVEDPAEVRPALERVLGSRGPALLDVVTDPNVLAMPPKATIAQAKGFALAMTKMAFAGDLDDVTDTVMSNRRLLP
jgi:pyruvate dehydrogenase (quinone)